MHLQLLPSFLATDSHSNVDSGPPDRTILQPVPTRTKIKINRFMGVNHPQFNGVGSELIGPAMNLQFPDGKSFAFTVFDDTDNATVENVRPV